jgi:dephospho-CoA kinase
MIVGLTGGIGSGKTVVAKMFADRGAVVIDTDRVAREVVEPPSEVLDRIHDEFGPGVLTPDGRLDRGAVAKMVFADERKRSRLNEITHPAILKRVLAEIGRQAPSAVVVVVAPLLFESGFDRNCQAVVAVAAPETVRLRRVIDRDRLTDPDARARMRTQMPDAEYERRATVVIRNEGDTAALAREVDLAWEALTARKE